MPTRCNPVNSQTLADFNFFIILKKWHILSVSIQSYRSLEIGITDLIFLFGPGPNKKIGPDRMVTETVKGPFSWTGGLGPVRSTEDQSVFVEP